MRAAMRGQGDRTINIVKRPDTAKGFIVLPRRWVVERVFAWLNPAEDWPRISNNPSKALPPSSRSHQSENSPAKSLGIGMAD
jgi:hypothetical protein